MQHPSKKLTTWQRVGEALTDEPEKEIMMRRLTMKRTMPLLKYLHSRMLAFGICGGLLLLSSLTVVGQCSSELPDGDFETLRSGVKGGNWFKEGNAGIEFHKGFSHSGVNNAWASNTTGWNAIHQRIQLSQGATYTLRAFVRTSANVRDGYFGFRDGKQPVSEIKFGALPAYGELEVRFRPNRTGIYTIFAGFWAPNESSWIRVDDVTLQSPCPDVILDPAENLL